MTTTTPPPTDNRVLIAPGVWVDKSLLGDLSTRRRLLLLDEDGLDLICLKTRHKDTLRRLHECGEIRICMISPRVWFLDVDSWEDLIDRSLADPWYWAKDGKALKKYRKTY